MNRSELEKTAISSQLIRSKRTETVRVIKNLKTEQNFCRAYNGGGAHLPSMI